MTLPPDGAAEPDRPDHHDPSAAVQAGAGAPEHPGDGLPVSGDPVCWASLVCAECGAMPDGPPPARCERCGTPRGAGGDAGR